MRIIALIMIGLSLLIDVPAHAVNPDEVLSDPKLEQRARKISSHLRCLVCQNQSIDDSDADLAKDLRVLVRERLTAGDDDTQVLDYIVARYGEYVLLRPRLGLHTILLWLGPLVVLIFGAWAVVRTFRRRSLKTGDTDGSLSADEEARLAAFETEAER